MVSIFGATSNGGSKQHQLYPALNLVDSNSSLSLYDPEGNLVDVFAYGSSAGADGKKSYQRKDPMVRGYVVAEGTPMAAASGASLNNEAIAAATKAWQEDGNTTMTRISQLFTISTGFAEKNLATSAMGNQTGTVYSNQLAELKVPEGVKTTNTTGESNSDPLPTNLDLRLVDVFTATPRNLEPESSSDADSYVDNGSGTSGRDAYQAFRQRMERLRNAGSSLNGGTANADEKSTNGVVYSYGKLNLNTCNKYALLGLDLSSAGAKGDAASIIEQFEGHRLTSVQQGKPAFTNISDFIGEFASGFTRNNLNALDAITNQVTVGSSAFEIISTNRLSPEEQTALETKGSSNGPRPATATARWVISLDQEPYSVISYTSVP